MTTLEQRLQGLHESASPQPRRKTEQETREIYQRVSDPAGLLYHVAHARDGEQAGAKPTVVYTVEAIDGDEALLDLLNYLKRCGSDGHSVSFKIDDKSFGFDGDGADKILSIKTAKHAAE